MAAAGRRAAVLRWSRPHRITFIASLLATLCAALPALAPAPARTQTSASKQLVYGVYDMETLKAQFAEDLTYCPKLIIVGDSRALRFDPGYIYAKTAVTGFNAAVRTSRPEDTYGIVRYVTSLNPQLRYSFLRIIYIDRPRGSDPPVPSPSLAVNWRVKPSFPLSFREWMKPFLPTSAQAAVRASQMQFTAMNFAAAGHLQEPRAVDPRADALGIESAINYWDKEAARPLISPQPQHYFESTLAFMNARRQAGADVRAHAASGAGDDRSAGLLRREVQAVRVP